MLNLLRGNRIPGAVRAPLGYLKSAARDGRDPTYQNVATTIRDARREAAELEFERNGFTLARHPSSVGDFFDDDEVRAAYYPEVADLIRRISGAKRVVPYYHCQRSTDPARREGRAIRDAIPLVHTDHADNAVQELVAHYLPDEAEKLLARRAAVIQVWQPFCRRVERRPLALCDAQSLAPQDLVTTTRVVAKPGKNLYHLFPNKRQRWFYYPGMTNEEAVLFKSDDTLLDGRARAVPHCSFDDPGAPGDPPHRESIETRTLAFF